MQKLNIFLRVCIFMVSLNGHEHEVRGGRCPRCVVAGTFFRHDLGTWSRPDFLNCVLGVFTFKSDCLLGHPFSVTTVRSVAVTGLEIRRPGPIICSSPD